VVRVRQICGPVGNRSAPAGKAMLSVFITHGKP
jgi:hypothetical protein